ncbi:MAG: putative dimethyl sulfoxide reductase chain YnfE [Gammaproteobacteria bacterium]|nr:putative dimethyl sulfoxide reductase chain YnfE [Gammaproteobacteria bacterium]
MAGKSERVHTTCPHDCPSACALEVERLDARTIGRVYGARDNPYTAGTLCAKVGRYSERVHHPERLAVPLRRVGAKGDKEAFEPMAWDDALDEVAERFERAVQAHGGETVWPYFYAGTMGLVQRDSIELFRHLFGYSRQHSTICSALSSNGWLAGAGALRGVDPREIADSDLLVVWGGNPVYTQVNLMHHIAVARRNRGARLVVVDPYRTATAEKADLHLMVRPGTDAALACAVMHVLFRDGHADRDYMARYTDAPDDLEQHLSSRTPAWAAAITGVDESDIEQFARWYGETPRSFLRLGYGFTRSRNGAVGMHAALCLPAVTGAWRYQGGGALHSNKGLFEIDKTLIEGLDVKDERVRILDQSRIGPILSGERTDLGDGPPVTAMIVQNTNPLVVCPESERVRRGFGREDLFVCVHEQFMTETARYADIVLPATTFLEHSDMYIALGHTFLQVTRPVIEPYAECRSNHWVLSQLSRRLGGSHPGFEMDTWTLMDETLKRSGLPGARTIYEQHWHDCAREFESAHFLDGFATRDRRFHFKPDWSNVGPDHRGFPVLPDYYAAIDASNADKPFRLVAAPARNYLNSSFTETPTSRKREKRPTLFMHPRDCTFMGLSEGNLVRIGNDLASVRIHVKPFEGVQPGVVVCESVWPSEAFEEGLGINALVSADPGGPNGGAVFHDTAVWIQPAHGR